KNSKHQFTLFRKDIQYYKFCFYGFFKNLKFFEPFLILFFLEKGLTYTQIGSLYAIREIGINLLEIPTGFMADALGRKRTMISSFTSYILSFIVFYLADGFWLLAFAMICFSFGEAFRTGTHKAMIFDYLKRNQWEDQKVAYYGHTRSWSQMGSALSSLLAALIVLLSGNYQMVFLISTVPYLADLVLVSTYPSYLDGDIKNNSKPVKEKLTEVWQMIRLSFKQTRLFRLFGNLAVYEGLFKASKDYLQPMVVLALLSYSFFPQVSEEQKTAIAIGLIYFAIYSLTAITTRNSGRIVKKIGTLGRTINISLAIGAISTIAIGFMVNHQIPVLAVSIFLLLFIIENLRKPAGISAVADTINPQILATGLSAQSQFDSLFAAVFAFTIGVIADHIGLGTAFITAGGLVLVLFPTLRVK
ncbi:MAG: MFS transporter, partial [Salinivirgaceae bacterium]|nr:MFS transporter [Salinivirgaceae bacterium]